MSDPAVRGYRCERSSSAAVSVSKQRAVRHDFAAGRGQSASAFRGGQRWYNERGRGRDPREGCGADVNDGTRSTGRRRPEWVATGDARLRVGRRQIRSLTTSATAAPGCDAVGLAQGDQAAAPPGSLATSSCRRRRQRQRRGHPRQARPATMMIGSRR